MPVKHYIAKVGLFDAEGRLCLASRTDDGRIDEPGGHVNGWETAEDAARRETWEEAKVKLGPLTYLGSRLSPDGTVHVTCFVAQLPDGQEPQDTDEMRSWQHTDISGGVPDEILGNLHAPHDAVLDLLGLLPAAEKPLGKAEGPAPGMSTMLPDDAQLLLSCRACPKDAVAELARHPNGGVFEAATRHPAFDGDAFSSLCGSSQGSRRALRLLQNGFPAQAEHLMALWRGSRDDPDLASDVARRVAAHPALDATSVAELLRDEAGFPARPALLRRPEAPLPELQAAVTGSEPRAALAAAANPSLGADTADRLLQGEDLDLALAASRNPSVSLAAIREVLHRGLLASEDDPRTELRASLYRGRQDLPDDLIDLGRRDRGESARRAADEAFALRSRPLAKTVSPEHFRAIQRASTPAGPSMVDHVGQAADMPAAAQVAAERYRRTVVESPTRYKPTSTASLGSGVSRKLVYEDREPLLSGFGGKYLVKPYHERPVARTGWVKHPYQGWAEMTNQALYHAAGIGHLHQDVHIAEHPVGPDGSMAPALVIRLGHGHIPMADADVRVDGSALDDPHVKEQGRRIAIMDFLTNNLDRHMGNLLIHPEKKQLLAIDHPRSFQYESVPRLRWHNLKPPRDRDIEDSLEGYVHAKGLGPLRLVPSVSTPSKISDHMKNHEVARKAFQETLDHFWQPASQKLQGELERQLRHIRAPELREHIRQNFEERARLLDQMQDIGVDNHGEYTWHQSTVPLHPYRGRR